MTVAVRFQALPPLSPEEYQQLESSIVEHGVLVPIIVDESGVVIDGHHRQKIAAEWELECPIEQMTGLSDSDKRTLALSLNLDRRHLNREQRRALVAESIKADPQLSDREHGRRTGVHQSTAGAVRRELEKVSNLDTFDRRLDPRTGNATQPASKPPRPEPEAPKARRRSITDSARDLSLDIQKLTKRIESFGADDRLVRSKSEIAARLRHCLAELIEAATVLDGLLN